MTTINHLNDFTELDFKTTEDLLKTADELLKVKHLDFDNTKYLAKVLFLLKRYDESIEQFKRALSSKSDDEEALAYIAICYFKKEDYESAIGYFDESLERNPDNESLLSYKMLSCEFIKDYADAVECGERILKNSPENTQVISRLIDYHLELKNHHECIYYANQIEGGKNYKKALVLYEFKRYEECIEAAVKLRTAESYHLAGKAHHKLGNTAKAARYLYKSYEKNPNTDILFEISEIYFEAGDYQRAIHFLKRVLIHDELNTEAYNRIALAYLKTAKWHDAIEYGEKTLKISTKVPQAYITLAEAHFQLEVNYETSKEIIDEGISQNPDSAELWAQKGGFYYPFDPFTFRETYEKAISLNPRNIDVYREYIFLLMFEEDEQTARKCYNRMLLFNPLFEKSFEELKKSMYYD